MNWTVSSLASSLLCLAIAACSTTDSAQSPPTGGLSERAQLHRLSWLTGTWRTERPDGYVAETWLPPQGGVMLGIGYTITGDELEFFEYLRIEAREGSLVYVAQPAGQSPGVEFLMTDITGEGALFENPEHDFPEWICYQRTSEGRCTASVGGKEGKLEFDYTKTP